MSKQCLFDRLLFGPSAFAMARAKVWVAMVVYLCASAPADLEAADAEAAAVSIWGPIFISASDNADTCLLTGGCEEQLRNLEIHVEPSPGVSHFLCRFIVRCW